MVNFRWIGTIVFFLLQNTVSKAQDIYLDTNWKYSFQDSATFASADFNDAEWLEKSGNALMFAEKELTSPTRTCWMRKRFVIPSNLKKKLGKAGALSLFLGKIYQSDVFYFNGVLVGKTASSDPKRAYLLDEKNIRWDKPNTVAIQIRYWGGKCGIEAAPPYIGSAVVATIFTFSSAAEGVDRKQKIAKKQTIYSCTVTNNTSKKAMGEMNATFYDLSNKVLKTIKQKVTLTEGANTLRFSFKSPSSFLKISYTLIVPELNYTAVWNDEFGYNDIIYKPAKMLIANIIAEHFTPADIAQQTLKGWLGQRLKANEEQRLNHVDEAALLAGYINKPGVHPWIGEHAGKFLEAATNTYQHSHNPKFKTQIDRTAQQLIASQLENGYFGTYTLENRWTSWDVWSHKYNIIGLLSYYGMSGFEPALNAAQKTGDLLCQTFGKNQGQKDIIKSGTHVGMAATSVLEPMIDLYRYTGDKKYLDFCLYLIESMEQENGPKIISTLMANGGQVDKTANSKSYEMMSNLVGLLKFYRVTGDEKSLKPVQLAWEDIVKNRLYITGTTSSFEHFKDNGVLPAGQKDNVGEGCVTTTWLQLNYQLFCISGEMKYLNELERSVYNQLTAAENPQTGCVSYFTPLSGVKPFSCNITCCMSSVPRGIAMIPLFANGTINGNPTFLLYQAGKFETTVNNTPVSFVTTTNFPIDGDVSIKVFTNKPSSFGIAFRKPYWAADFSINVNGEKIVIKEDENTVIVNRTWQKDDAITIHFSMPVLVLDGGKTYPEYVALQRGPQVLSIDNTLNTVKFDDISINPTAIQLEKTPSVLPEKWVGSEAYQLKILVNKENKNVILVPFADASQTGGKVETWLKKGQ